MCELITYAKQAKSRESTKKKFSYIKGLKTFLEFSKTLFPAVICRRFFRIRVRRTNRVKYEVGNHSVEEYVVCVEELYEKLSFKAPVKTMRLCAVTDELHVIKKLNSRCVAL